MDSQIFHAFAEEYQKLAAELTPETRAKIPGKEFAVSAKSSNTGAKAYPIDTKQRAVSALGFSKMHGDAKDIAEVRKDVAAKYPDLIKKKEGSRLTELAGLGTLALPSLDQIQAHARAVVAGDYNKGGVSKRELLPAAAHPLGEVAGLGILAAPYLKRGA